MLPDAYQLPAAIVMCIGGFLACFAGYRLFRLVLAIYGFILGAMLASSMMASGSPALLVIAAVVGGIVGGLILMVAYFIGVALVGAGIGALLANVIWTQLQGDPPALVVVVFSAVGAVAAMFLQRYVIIVGTAFGGAWTLLVAALTLVGDRVALDATGSGDVWIWYPTTPPAATHWVYAAWLFLAVFGVVVQVAVTGRQRR